jgi:hypothetical protein
MIEARTFRIPAFAGMTIFLSTRQLHKYLPESGFSLHVLKDETNISY